MSLKAKTIFNVKSNRKIEIEVNPSNGGSSGGGSNSTIKFFPSGATETYTYDISEIIHMDYTDNIYYYYDLPCEQIYSFLSPNTQPGNDILQSIPTSDIINGIIPILNSYMYNEIERETIGEKYGLLYKSVLYNNIISAINFQLTLGFSISHSLQSIVIKKVYQDNKLIIKGKILSEEEPYNYSSSTLTIRGIKYKQGSPNEIEYYNNVIVPDYTKTTQINDNTNYIAVNASNMSSKSFYELKQIKYLKKVVDETFYGYIYTGSNPLLGEITNKATITIPNGFPINDWDIVLLIRNDNIISAMITTNTPPGNGDNNICNITSSTILHYERLPIKNVDFYRKETTEIHKVEDVIKCNLNGIETFYFNSQGLGRFDDLLNILHHSPQDALSKKIIEECDEADYGNTFTYVGGGIYSLGTLRSPNSSNKPAAVNAYVDCKAYVATSLVGAVLEEKKTYTLSTAHAPLGKNQSINTSSGTVKSALGEKFNNSSQIGGGIPYVTETRASVINKKVLGEGGSIKNLNLDGVFKNNGEFEIACDNFYQLHQNLHTITTTVKGIINLQFIVPSSVKSNELLYDRIVYDFLNNGTIFDYMGFI